MIPLQNIEKLLGKDETVERTMEFDGDYVVKGHKVNYLAVTNKRGLLWSTDSATILEIPKDKLTESGYEEDSVIGDVIGLLANIAAFIFLIDE